MSDEVERDVGFVTFSFSLPKEHHVGLGLDGHKVGHMEWTSLVSIISVQ